MDTGSTKRNWRIHDNNTTASTSTTACRLKFDTTNDRRNTRATSPQISKSHPKLGWLGLSQSPRTGAQQKQPMQHLRGVDEMVTLGGGRVLPSTSSSRNRLENMGKEIKQRHPKRRTDIEHFSKHQHKTLLHHNSLPQ